METQFIIQNSLGLEDNSHTLHIGHVLACLRVH
jgi:hypothetical protein